MKTCTVDHAVMLHNLTGKELNAWLGRLADAQTFRSHWSKKLRKAISGNDPAGLAEARHRLLSDPRSAFASVVGVNAKLSMKRRVTLEQCETIASEIDLSKPILESVIVRCKKKSGGGIRVYSEFGIRHRTRQAMIGTVMRAYHHPRPWQFGMMGVHRAIEIVRDRISAGACFAAHLDIVDFHGSFDPDKLPHELPLPPEVVESAVIGRHLEMVLDKAGATHAYALSQAQADLLAKARQGLPSGSSCSPVVADFVLARLSWPESDQGALVNLVDNFLLLGPTQSALEGRIKELHKSVGQLPGGQFKLHMIGKGKTDKPFEFLGHRFTLGKSGLQIEPTVANWERLNIILSSFDKDYCSAAYGMNVKDVKKVKFALAGMFAFASGWLKAFKLSTDIEEYKDYAMGEIAQRCNDQGFTFGEIAAAVDPSMHYTPSGYDFAA